jgi:hypothetical protein
MSDLYNPGRGSTHVDDVVAVEVTIDGMLVIADRLHLAEFPPAMGIRPNIPQLDLRDLVWDQVARDLTAQGVLDVFGAPHPEVAAMVDTLSRADRTLEGRWWRRDLGGKMVRFVVCRKRDRHVVVARDGDMIVLQRVAPQVGLAGMVTAVLGPGTPADVEPLTGLASKLGESRTANQLGGDHRQRASPGRYLFPRRSRRGCARLSAGPDRLASPPGQRRAVRKPSTPPRCHSPKRNPRPSMVTGARPRRLRRRHRLLPFPSLRRLSPPQRLRRRPRLRPVRPR